MHMCELRVLSRVTPVLSRLLTSYPSSLLVNMTILTHAHTEGVCVKNILKSVSVSVLTLRRGR